MSGLGRHLLAELYGCSFERLDDLDLLTEVTLDAVARSGATILSHHFRRFQPQGVTGVVIIAESHLSLHTWPEHGYAGIDYFTCGDQIDIHLAVDLLEAALAPHHAERSLHWRGGELAGAPHRPGAPGESSPPKAEASVGTRKSL